MGYIVDHEIIKSWNMYKSIIYIKNGLHIGPLLGLNVVQYTKPLTSFKNAQGSPKNGLRRSAIAILRRYCRLKTDVKIIIYSRDLAGVSVTLWQRVTFLHLWHHCVASKENAPAEGHGLHPFFDPHGSKNSLLFRPTKWTRKKSARTNAPKKLPQQFLLAHLLLKNNFSVAKIISKKWSSPVARISVRFVCEPRKTKKREIITPSHAY